MKGDAGSEVCRDLVVAKQTQMDKWKGRNEAKLEEVS